VVAPLNAPNLLETVENAEEPLPETAAIDCSKILGKVECRYEFRRMATIKIHLVSPSVEQRLLARLWREEFSTTIQSSSYLTESAGADMHVWWCGRIRAGKLSALPISINRLEEKRKCHQFKFEPFLFVVVRDFGS
jgi:hypothetical protein